VLVNALHAAHTQRRREKTPRPSPPRASTLLKPFRALTAGVLVVGGVIKALCRWYVAVRLKCRQQRAPCRQSRHQGPDHPARQAAERCLAAIPWTSAYANTQARADGSRQHSSNALAGERVCSLLLLLLQQRLLLQPHSCSVCYENVYVNDRADCKVETVMLGLKNQTHRVPRLKSFFDIIRGLRRCGVYRPSSMFRHSYHAAVAGLGGLGRQHTASLPPRSRCFGRRPPVAVVSLNRMPPIAPPPSSYPQRMDPEVFTPLYNQSFGPGQRAAPRGQRITATALPTHNRRRQQTPSPPPLVVPYVVDTHTDQKNQVAMNDQCVCAGLMMRTRFHTQKTGKPACSRSIEE